MIYIRKIFQQDLRDGKQIAFPNEPSNIFFEFSFQNQDADKTITFVFKEEEKNNPNSIHNGKAITTRLYAAGSESRIDGQLKRFLIDDLKAKVDDKIIFSKINNNKYEFEFIPSSSPFNGFITHLLKSKNHEVLLSTSEESISSNLPVVIKDKTLNKVLYESFKYIINQYGEENILKNTSEGTSKIGENSFSTIIFNNHFNQYGIIATFTEEQSKESLTSGGILRYFDTNLELSVSPYAYFTTQWNGKDDKGRSLGNFNKFLKDVSNDTLEIIKEEDIYRLVNKGRKVLLDNYQAIGENKIYFGAPGTGKSYAIKEKLKRNNVNGEHYARITFHPDFDYTSFVGGYKPYTDANDDNKIKYKFVPQIFIDSYVKAWSKPNESFYLVIEEINRGNCAEIFGDIFQLLDRNPEYNIEPSTELKEYLETIEKEENVKLLFDGKLQMPERLSILASMNTSDQSLYPMDSAFKRRWEWEYIAINTECTESNFIIEITDTHKYSWLEFLQQVNIKIYNVTKSEDKQIGNWFINATKTSKIISKPTFINKVIFYLWNDIFKDEVFHTENIFVLHNNDGSKQNISFNDFFNAHEQEKLLINLMESVLKVSSINENDKTEDQTENDSTDGNNVE